MGRVETTARSTRLKIKEIQRLQQKFDERLVSDVGLQYPANLSDVLFRQPYCRLKDVVAGCVVSRPTATKYLNALVEADMLKVHKPGREKLYVNIHFMRILQATGSDM